MKKFCTIFVMIVIATSCAKKFEEEKAEAPDRQYASIEYFEVIESKSGEQSQLIFNQGTDISIPSIVDIDKGEAAGQQARVYIDFIGGEYAYYCRYLPSLEGNFFEFDQCFNNDKDEALDIANSYYSGYSEFIYKDRSIVLEIVNSSNLAPLEASLELEVTQK